MSAWRERLRLTQLAIELEQAHGEGVAAASAGLQDPGLGAARLTGTAVPLLAEAAVSSVTPFLRAPLLSRLHRARRLHTGAAGAPCPTCGVPVPCPTAEALDA